MVIAFERFFLGWWTIHEAYNELQRGGIEPGGKPDLRGSNQFAIAPERSAEGVAMLVIDPHLQWGDQYRFWEFRMHAGDVYELTLSPEPDPDSGRPRYLFDGEWLELTPRRVTIEVKDAEPQEHTFWSSHHGPVIALHGDKAWAAKTAYQDATTANSAMWQLNMAKDYTGAVRAMETLELFPQNIMVADTSGNIYYQRTGRVPRRPSGFDWSAPVDGSTSATRWLGFHPSSDHLQVLNPSQGYMQNCNIPPDAMMPDSPFSLDETTDYIYSSLAWGPSRDGWIGQRGARAIELLSADESVTAEEAIAYVNDVTVFGADRWIEALRLADDAVGTDLAGDEHYRAGLEDLLTWDYRNPADSTGALKHASWRAQLVEDNGRELARELAGAIDDHYAIIEQRERHPLVLSTEQLNMLTQSLASSMDAIEAQHGSLDATFGDHYRVGRDDESWPLGGSGNAPGTITLRAMWYGRSDNRDGHTTRAMGGQSSTQVVVMSDPPQSWIYAPLGQSDREASPHFDDQAEKLFSPRQLRPSWWLPEDRAPHIESRTVLER
jgi:acyl-homoserine lactone acylase PvdQ